MRLRNIKGSREVIGASDYVVHEEETKAGTWHEIFGNDNPLYIEVGMGKGQFIMELAKRHPENNYVGIEKYSSVLLRALEKMDREETPLPNLVFIRMDAENIEKVFAEGEVDGIYLNFSDPWPKKRHTNRRLTSPVFLEKYDTIFKNDKKIIMKTDNRHLFEYSVKSFTDYGYKIENLCLDLYAEDTSLNIPTEYEEKFVAKNMKIYYTQVNK